MASVTGVISQRIQLQLPSTGTPVSYPIQAALPKLDRTYATGTAAGMVDGAHCKTYTLAATPTTLDLTALTDPNGTAITCLRVREFAIQNLSQYPLVIGNAASNQWVGMISTTTGTLTIPPYGVHQFSDPSTVGAGNGAVVTSSSKNLKFDPGSNTVSFNLLIGMCSAVS